MDRRTFLVGATGVLMSLTGCISDSPSGPAGNTPTGDSTKQPPATNGDEPTTVPENSRTESRRTTNGGTDGPDDPYFEINSENSEPQKLVAVNHRGVVEADATQRSPSSYDTIRVWNDNSSSMTVELTIRVKDRPANPLDQETYVEESPENPLVRENYTIEPDAFITVQLLKPGTYEVGVTLDKQATETIEYRTDNCNGQTLKIKLTPNGLIQSMQLSTTMACVRTATSETSPDG